MPLAPMVEQGIPNLRVGGSSPSRYARICSLSSMVERVPSTHKDERSVGRGL